ncbi:MAG: Zn-ribbon domain-containing OB-fold protein [Candidatus Binatia bacterium]
MSKPLPRIDEESKGYWEACQRRELVVQRCGGCGTLRHYPRALCPRCLSDAVEWLRCSGRGTVYTFTVTHQNQAPGFRDALPYVLAYVELEEGVRLLTNVVECAPEAVRIGMAVEVVFEDATPAVTLAKFRPA